MNLGYNSFNKCFIEYHKRSNFNAWKIWFPSASLEFQYKMDETKEKPGKKNVYIGIYIRVLLTLTLAKNKLCIPLTPRRLRWRWRWWRHSMTEWKRAWCNRMKEIHWKLMMLKPQQLTHFLFSLAKTWMSQTWFFHQRAHWSAYAANLWYNKNVLRAQAKRVYLDEGVFFQC